MRVDHVTLGQQAVDFGFGFLGVQPADRNVAQQRHGDFARIIHGEFAGNVGVFKHRHLHLVARGEGNGRHGVADGFYRRGWAGAGNIRILNHRRGNHDRLALHWGGRFAFVNRWRGHGGGRLIDDVRCRGFGERSLRRSRVIGGFHRAERFRVGPHLRGGGIKRVGRAGARGVNQCRVRGQGGEREECGKQKQRKGAGHEIGLFARQCAPDVRVNGWAGCG